MKRELFKAMLSQLIADEKGDYPLDLRAWKEPFTQKDSEVFSIDDLDGAYDYIEDSEDWFVDIYAITLDGKYSHADYTGSTLTFPALKKAMEEEWQKEPKTAYEKFEARLKELELLDEWCEQGRCGRIAKTTKDGIVILCNEGESDKAFTESWFPPMSEMEQSDTFRLNALYEFCDHDDDVFLHKLCLWVARPINPCPLFPVDVYFCWENPKVIFFEDDTEKEEEAPAYKVEKTTEEWCQHCDECVDLAGEFKVQRCPHCGKWIVPCSLCPFEDCVTRCPLERLALILNSRE